MGKNGEKKGDVELLGAEDGLSETEDDLGLDDDGYRKFEPLRTRRGFSMAQRILSEEQKFLQQRLLDTLQFGVEEVDVRSLFEGMSHRDVYAFGMGMQAVQLSSFCRGNCGFCGLSSKPYGQNNRQILGLESLTSFLSQVRPTLGAISLYDASDPLDYPGILELVTFLENHPDYREVNILTSCPNGSEEMFKALMGGGFEKLKMQLSLSDQNGTRVRQNGILDWIYTQNQIDFFGRSKLKPVNERAIGRAHVSGRLAAGFGCGDEMVLSPNGPLFSEYHVASDLYPNERRTRHLSEVRRVYMKDLLFNLSMGSGMFNGPRIYTPESHYYDLDDNHRFKTETAMRHLFAYMFSVAENMWGGCRYNSIMEDNWLKIKKALDESKFEMSKDPKEAAFYKQTVRELLNQMKAFVGGGYLQLFPPGMLTLEWPPFDIQPYKKLVMQMDCDIQRYGKLLTDR